MSFEAKVFKILIASPGDVDEEREVIPLLCMLSFVFCYITQPCTGASTSCTKLETLLSPERAAFNPNQLRRVPMLTFR